MNSKKKNKTNNSTVSKNKVVRSNSKKTQSESMAKTTTSPAIVKNQEVKNVNNNPLLTVENLNMLFKVRGSYFKALDDVSFTVNEGDFFGIIGESGSGKSTTGKCIIKLYQPTGGKIEIDGNLVSNKKLTKPTKKWLRKNVQMIFQDPMASLNPTKNILQLISEPLAINKSLYIDSFKRWQELNNVSKHFFGQFMEEKNKILYEFKKVYYTTMIKKFNESFSIFERMDLSKHSFNSGREKIIFNMDTFVEKINESTNVIYEYSKQFKDLIQKLTDEYFARGYDKLNNKKFKSKNGIILGEKDGVITQEYDSIEKKIELAKNDFMKDFSAKKSQYLQSAEITIKGKLKSIKQNIEFSKDELTFTLNQIDLYSKKVLLSFINKLKKCKYVSLDLINQIISSSSNIIEELFKPLVDFINKINFEFENASIQDKNKIIEKSKYLMNIAKNLYSLRKKDNWRNYELFKTKFNISSSQELINEIFETNEEDFFFNFVSNHFKQLDELWIKAQIDLYAKKVLLNVINELQKYKYLSFDLINEIISSSSNIIEELFKPLVDFINKISLDSKNASIENKNEIIGKSDYLMNIVENLYSLRKSDNWKDRELFKTKFNISSSQDLINEIFETNEEDFFFNFVSNHFEQLDELLTKAKNEDLLNHDSNKQDISSLNKSLPTSVNKENSNQEEIENKTITKEDMELTKLKEENSRSSYRVRKEYENSFSEEERLLIQEKENSQKAEIDSLHADYEKTKSELNKLINSELKTLSKILVKEQKATEKNLIKKSVLKLFDKPFNFLFFKREVNLRWKSLSSIEFEYKNVISEIKYSSFICEQIRYINWVALKKFVSLIKKERVYNALDSVGLKREHAYRYPHEFSGGQRQRIVIARALINQPKIIIADEPISALDVSIQAQIINILQDLCLKQKVTILFIAHDLSMVNYACNNVIIMHRGRILEKGNIDKIFKNPIHPYTRSLMKATPKLSRVHVDLAAFNENFTYDKEWSAFNKPDFIRIKGDEDHQVYGTKKQVSEWEKDKFDDEQ